MPSEQRSPLPLVDNFPVQIQISIFPSGSEYTAYVSADMGVFHRFHIGLKQHDIEELNSGLQQAIEQVVSSFETGGTYDEALSRLAQKGNFAFKRIFAEGIPREIVSRALKTSATIQVSSGDFFIPWELLYDGSLSQQVDVSRFWGMQHIISRALIQEARSGDLESPVIHSPCPNVGVIACNSLKYVVEQEIPALRKLHNSKRIRLSCLRPMKADNHNKEIEDFGRFLGKNFHIAHLACHGREMKPVDQSYLLVSDEFPITIEEFRGREIDIKHNPFIILNACLTGTISPLYTSNWAALFWRRGARGVLATELHVPDWFAAAFTEELYKHFLSGKPIGEALLATRRYFWEGRHNPLGLAYALYSSPSIRIVNSN